MNKFLKFNTLHLPALIQLRSLAIFLFSTQLLVSCLSTSDPSLNQNQNQSNSNAMTDFKRNVVGVKSIDARNIFVGNISGDFSNASTLSLTFLGNSKPSLRFYRHELSEGMEFSLIPPRHDMSEVLVEKLDGNRKKISSTIIKLKRGKRNIIQI